MESYNINEKTVKVATPEIASSTILSKKKDQNDDALKSTRDMRQEEEEEEENIISSVDRHQDQMMLESSEADDILPIQKKYRVNEDDIQHEMAKKKRERSLKASTTSAVLSCTNEENEDQLGKEKGKERQEREKKESALADFIQQLNKGVNKNVENENQNIKEIFSKYSIQENGIQTGTENIELLTWEQIALILYEGGSENTSKFSNLMKDLEKEKFEQIFGKSVMKYLFVDDAFEVYNETCNIFSLQDFLTSQQFSKDTLEAEARACRGNRSNKVENSHGNENRNKYNRITANSVDTKPKYLRRMQKKRKADAIRLKEFVSNRLQELKQ